MARRALFTIMLGLLTLAMSYPVHSAPVIVFETTNLFAGFWQYDYTVSGFDFVTNQGFTIQFAPGLYGNLEDPPPSPGPDWTTLVSEPVVMSDPQLDGYYDAMAVVDHASLAQKFSIQFEWFGAGSPGAQPFEIYHWNPDETFEVLGAGTTQSAVPEPAAIWLAGGALGLALFRARKRK